MAGLALCFATSALAQSSDMSPASSFADISDGAARVGRDAVRATDQAARAVQEHVEDAWAASVAREPALELQAPPREAKRAPKPKVAARPGTDHEKTDQAKSGGGKQHALSGIASYYWQGEMTASGERFDKRAMTAAHPSLPFGTKVKVFCANTGREVVVRINDRGPFKPGRVIDLSEAAAEAIGMQGRGLTLVQLEVVRN